MANLEILALDTAVPQIRAPGASDGYSAPRSMTFAAGTTLTAQTMNVATLSVNGVVFTDASKNLTSTGTVPISQGGTGLTSTPVNGAIDIGNGTGFTRTTLTAGSNISITNGAGSITIAATGSSGTVTSVSGTGTVNGITLTGTVTTSGSLTLGGTLSNVSLSTQVTDTLPLANGGTGQTTAQAAINSLAGAVTSGQYLRGNGTNVVMSAIQAADVPTLNQNTTGTASNVTGTVAIANGGTGQTTQQTALNALAGATTSGFYLRGNGTNVLMAALAAGDLSGTVAVANGGTGQTSYTNGQLLIGNTTGNTLTKSTLTAGTGISITNGAGSITIASTASGGAQDFIVQSYGIV